MAEIDTVLFRNIIEDRGCFCVFEDVVNGITVSHYFPNNSSKRVLIVTSDEFISKNTAINHLFDLELQDIIPDIPFS
uniref:hypothetical protein n=1 Tax=Flavobacterium sp. TaxID=239 RepID=UPI00404AF9CC